MPMAAQYRQQTTQTVPCLLLAYLTGRSIDHDYKSNHYHY
jgi:hypothetical protein